MIQPNDLRIGNWVQFPFTGIEQVGDIKRVEQDSGENDEYYISSVNDRFPRHYSLINPILITSEILQKCGFIRYSQGFWFWKNSIYSIEPESKWWQVYYSSNDRMIRKIKYIHELENFYFSITGKELEILW